MRNKKIIAAILVVLLVMFAAASVSAQSTTRRSSTPKTYTLTVNSNVSGANVTVTSGGEKGVTKKGRITYSASFDPGTYTVTVSAAKYQDGTATVNLNSNQTITINLNPLQATIVPSTQHPDFVVIVDGRQQGSGPVKVDPGTHTVEFRIGALTASGTYNFEAGKAYRIQPTLGIDFDF